jgi:hypothetical protein
MWIFILLVVIGILIKFFYDMGKQKEHVARQGGMQHKFRRLIEQIKMGDPRSRIYRVTGDQIILGVSNMGGKTIFIITQTFGRVTIQWNLESPVFGKHNLEWEFDEYLEQDKMMEKITNDLMHYQNNVITSQSSRNIH